MKKQFIGKTICFLGDSITEHGHYLYKMRSYFHGQKESCKVYNRGTGGNRAVMAQYILDFETKGMSPDYVVISFGVNDVGIWLYDSQKPITEELLAKRKVRDDEYLSSMRLVANMIKERGITPIIMSPCAVDQLLTEREDIETLGDNKEKEDYIGPSFYKRKNFENINDALRGYVEVLKQIAEETGALYIPAFEQTFKAMIEMDGVFNNDGIHLSKDVGHTVLAKTILEFLGVNDIPESFSISEENDKIYNLEQTERNISRFYTGHGLNPMFGDITEEYRKKVAQHYCNSDALWMQKAGKAYLELSAKLPEIRAEIFKLTQDFCG